jgi:molybdopterin-guanine dinucleotide biosynthesis protein A
MGRPKQLLVHRGINLAVASALALEDHVEDVIVVGDGELPTELEAMRRVADPPGLSGPVAGVLAAMRWSPESAWIVAACDMPRVRAQAVAWLMSHRQPGVWAVMPRSAGGKVESTFALYEPQARHLLESQVAAGKWGPRHLAENRRVVCPTPPPELEDAWLNVNTPEEMRDSLSSDV